MNKIFTFLGFSLAHTSDFLLEALSSFLALIVFVFMPKRRRITISNLNYSFPEKSLYWKYKVGFISAKRSMETGMFVLASAFISKKQLKKRFTVSDNLIEELKKYIKNNQSEETKKPLVLLIPHFSMMEAITLLPILTDLELPKTGVFYRPFDFKPLEDWVLKARQQFGINLLSRKKGALQAASYLKEKNCVALLFDQNTGGAGSASLFFDRVCSSSELGGILIERFKPLSGFFYAQRTGFWKANIDAQIIQCEPQSGQILATSNLWLENLIKSSENLTKDFLWMHARWKVQEKPSGNKFLSTYNKKSNIENCLKVRNLSSLPRKTKLFIRMPESLTGAILSIPILKAIQKNALHIELTLFCKNEFVCLFEKLNICQKIISLPKKKTPILYFVKFLKYRKLYPSFYINLENTFSSDLEAFIINAPISVGISKSNKKRFLLTHTWNPPSLLEENYTHKTLFWHEFLKDFGLNNELEFSPIKIDFSNEFDENKNNNDNSYGFICSLENSPEKCWDKENYILIIKQILEKNPDAKIKLFGTKNDNTTNAYIKSKFENNSNVINLSGKTNLFELSKHLSSCGIVVGGDNGAINLANALGTKTIVIYGPSNPVKNGTIFEADSTIICPEYSPEIGGLNINLVNPKAVINKIL